ncbi:hypothetical protein [Nannocystis punicea]|uniref:Uncharacterized protein n=1 Tax=Nannocystis punicea TaxID=2995304 RepID=A0ABY7GSW5_9BACT|nr:hypothetical protein [Nannocystis poenicansa]WAS90008.1 hypothetical protein O0S08_27760 [Nannocystis poenicansa]
MYYQSIVLVVGVIIGVLGFDRLGLDDEPVRIPGVSQRPSIPGQKAAQTIIAEMGVDMSRFRSAGHRRSRAMDELGSPRSEARHAGGAPIRE